MKMSGLNGGGEMSLGNLKVEIAESNIATSLFAQDIVNEVLQKALTIVAQLHESNKSTRWDSIGENKAHLIGEYVKKGTELCDISLAEAITRPSKMETEKVEIDADLLPCKDLPGRGGVGDQPIIPRQSSEVEVSDQPAPQECPATPVEKKSRVADLVKSSKQVLSAYIMDEKTRQIRDDLELRQEQFLQPETIPLPNDDAEIEDEFQEIPGLSCVMETIDLNQEKSETAKGGKETKGNTAQKHLDVIPEIVRDGPSDSSPSTCELNKDKKKKKWNLGARIMQFIRRPKQKARGTQTVTRK